MVMSPAGTFDYQVTVPEGHPEAAFPWPLRLRAPVGGDRHSASGRRLVGHSPALHITSAGFPTERAIVGRTGLQVPKTLRSRFSLNATERTLATVACASFHVDEGVTARLRAGDVINMSRTGCGGLGISVLRDGRLVVAAGAVTRVPLGDDLSVRIPGELVNEAEAIFRRRDPEYRFSELPTELKTDHETRLLAPGWSRVGSYTAFLVHGPVRGIPGNNECLGITRVGIGGDTTASCTALLLGAPHALDSVSW